MDMLSSRTASPKKRFSPVRVLEYTVLLLLAAGLLYLSFKGVKWSDFRKGIESCNYYWIFASMFIGFSGFVFRALRWRLLLLPLNKDITRRETYHGVTIAYLTNFALPRAGELARCGVIAGSRKVSFEGALGTVVLERSFDLFCLLIWMLLLLAFKWAEFGSFLKEELIKPFAERFSAGWIWISAAMAAIILSIVIAGIWIFRKRLAKIRFFRKIADIIKGLTNGLMTAFRMKNKGLFFLFTFLLWGSYWLTSLTTIYAFPSVGHLGGADALFLMIAGGLGWVIPVQGGLGAYHFIISLALSKIYLIPQTTGVIFATISHESQALVMILCGTLSLISIAAANKIKTGSRKK